MSDNLSGDRFDVTASITSPDGVHLALVRGSIDTAGPVNVRVHSQCMLGEVLGSVRCDCGRLLNSGMDYIARHGGVFLYMRQTDPESDLALKLDAYEREDEGLRGRAEQCHPEGSEEAMTQPSAPSLRSG